MLFTIHCKSHMSTGLSSPVLDLLEPGSAELRIYTPCHASNATDRI